MSQQFTPDKGLPPTRFRPSAGQVGADAAQRALKPPTSGKKRGASPSASKRLSSGGAALGLPRPPPQVEQPQQDNSRLGGLYLRWLNSRGLGREAPFAVWLHRVGAGIELQKPGEHPFDVFAGDDEYAR